MKTDQLTGSVPWFARVKRGRRCELRPYSRAGWLLTGGFAVAVTGFSLLLLARDEPSMVLWVSWGAVTATMTIAFILIAWRTSEPMPASALRKPKISPGATSILIALAMAALTIGAALLGVEF